MTKNKTANLTLLLPVYNGEAYLESQLDSLLNQTYQSWICIIRDDGSNDNSLAILVDYEKRFPDKFIVLRDDLGNLGTKACLNIISKYVSTPLFGFCDQDDVWCPNKLEMCVFALENIALSKSIPLLVYCDMIVVNDKLETIQSSFFRMIYEARYSYKLKGLPFMNVAAGCSMVGNIELYKAVFPIPSVAPMHDYWVALVCKFSGYALSLEQPLMLYRQHAHNQLGAGKKLSLWKRTYKRFSAPISYINQAKRTRKLRVGMFNELLMRNIKSLNKKACLESLESENGDIIKKIRYLKKNRIRIIDSIQYLIG